MEISFGKTIALYRKNKNWSQSDLGKAAGISRNFVSMIERDEANVTIGTLSAVCAALGIEMSIVMGGLKSRLTPHAADGSGCDEIYHDFLAQWEDSNFCDLCGRPIRR